MNRQLRCASIIGVLGFATLLMPSARAQEPVVPLHRIDAGSSAGLRELFKPPADATLPLVSAHRGGPGKGFPENCIATFEHTLRHTRAIMEIDPRYTRDGAIVLHHDPRLERTTTGKGAVADHTLAELKKLRLKDIDGNPTDHQIPTLDEALEWARGRTILVLDQKDVPVAIRVKKIQEHKAQAFAIVIVYNFKEARACHELDKDIMMEVMIPSREKAAEFEKTGVPWENVVAFVGHTPPADPSIFKLLRDKGASALVGTSRNLDQRLKNPPAATREQLQKSYRALLDGGANVIETDLPREVGPLLYEKTAIPSDKAKFFPANSPVGDR